MNVKKVYLLNLLLSTSSVFGQTNTSPAFIDKIRTIVNDSSSAFYYPTLVGKIQMQPDSLTKEDLYYVYYGQLVQPNHKPLSFLNPEHGNFMKLVGQRKCRKVISVGYKILEENPVELTTLLHTNTCIKELSQQDIYHLKKRFNLLIEGILSTGGGLTKETAIKISDIEDDRVIKGILGFLGGTESSDAWGGKAFSVWTKSDGKKLYFEDVWTYVSFSLN